MPDKKTIHVYSDRAEEFAALYNSTVPAFHSRIIEAASNGGKRLLDIGCGSGRDMAVFAEEGFEVTGIEPAKVAIQLAEKNFPQLKERIHCGYLPDNLVVTN